MHEAQNAPNVADGQQTHQHALHQEEALHDEAEESVSNEFADAGDQLWTSFAEFVCRICDILEPQTVDNFAEEKEGQYPDHPEDE